MPKKFDSVWTNKIVAMTEKGHSVTVIQKWLKSKGVHMSKQSVWYYAKGLQKPRYGVCTKSTPEVRKLVETLSRENVELHAKQIKRILKSEHDIDISETSIRRIRRQLRGTFEPTSMNLVKDDKTIDEALPEDLQFDGQNMCSAPDTSSHEPRFSVSPIVLPSDHLSCCINNIVEEAVEKALSSVSQVAQDAVKKALSSVNRMAEDAVKKALSSVNQVVEEAVKKALSSVSQDDNSSPSLPPLWEAHYVEQVPSVAEVPQHYDNYASTSSSDCMSDHSSTTNVAAEVSPLTVASPITNFTLPALDSSKLYFIQNKACNEPHRFAQLLFQELVPYDVYKNWTHTVNYDGSRGKQALPENLREAIIKETKDRFIVTPDTAKKIKGTLNALLRMPRASRW